MSSFFDAVPATETDPCDQRDLDMAIPGTATLTRSQILLHEFLHLPYLLGPKHDVILDITKTTYNAHALLFPDKYNIRITGIPNTKIAPIWSVNNYVIFAKWAWISSQQSNACPGIQTLSGALDHGSIDQKIELRKLLGEDGASEEDSQVSRSDLLNCKAPSENTFYANAIISSFNISGLAYSIIMGSNFFAIEPLPNEVQMFVNITDLSSP